MSCDEGSRGFIVVAFCSAILHHWMCKIPTEVAMLMVNIKRPFKDEYICKTSHFSSTSLFFFGFKFGW
ncbi:hypothetical protein X973_14845 [Piscirickettsia salmonis]|nr:hypothetical protein X973_14845 [Piscirickettsia salmonis]